MMFTPGEVIENDGAPYEVIYAGNGGYPVDYDKAEMAGLAIGGRYFVQAVRFSDTQGEVGEIRLLGYPGWHNARVFDEAELIDSHVIDTDTFLGEGDDELCDSDQCCGGLAPCGLDADPGDDVDMDADIIDNSCHALTINITINVGDLVVNLG